MARWFQWGPVAGLAGDQWHHDGTGPADDGDDDYCYDYDCC